MNMQQLADVLNVSVSTISKAFSGSPEISEKTQKLIFSAAKKMGCYDKYCNRNFAKKVIAVICPEFQSRYYSQHLTYLKKEIEKYNGIMVVGSYDFDGISQKELLSYFTESAKVDGVIIIGSNNSKAKYNTPIVVIGHDENLDSIWLSMKTAIKDAIECLVKNAHTDIAYIGEELTKNSFNNFAEAMIENNLKINDSYVIKSKERFEQAGYDGMNTLLALEKPPTAVLAAYDSIAIGAMKSIYEHGLKVPDDISIIGMDDSREAAYLSVPLASITSYTEDLCQITVDLLFERIEKGDINKIKRINVSTSFLNRNSVGKAKNSNDDD